MMRPKNPFDELGQQLTTAANHSVAVTPRAQKTSWLSSRRPAIAGAAVAVAVGAIVLSTDIGSGSPDPLSAAAAALDANGQVVHLVLEGGPVQPDGRPAGSILRTKGSDQDVTFERRIEQWSTSDPLRFRSTQTATSADGKRLGTFDNGVTASGTVWSDQSWDDQPAAEQTLKSAAPLGDGASVGAFGTPDPAQLVRTELQAGRLRVDGESTVDGQRAIRMVTKNENVGQDRKFVYLADAKTYAPLELRTYSGSALTDVLTVKSYETRPLDGAADPVFRIPTP